jgi:putative FmdB family regulatory protein
MPIYEYQCTACGARLEKIQKMSDAPLIDCPECGKPGLEKLVSAAGFVLKGSGWYKDDYATKPKPKPKTETKAERAVETKATDSK